MAYITTDSTNIYYSIQGQGPPILFLHGLTLDHRALLPLAAQFATSNTAIHIDLRGHGQSGWDETVHDVYQAVVNDIVTILGQTGHQPVVTVGYSLGGQIAMLLSEHHPDLVKGVVLIATGLRYRHTMVPEHCESGQDKLHIRAEPEIAKRCQEIVDDVPELIPECKEGYAKAVRRFRYRDWKVLGTKSACIIAGEIDAYFSLEETIKLAAVFDNKSEVHQVKNSTHGVPIERPQDCARHIKLFFNKNISGKKNGQTND